MTEEDYDNKLEKLLHTWHEHYKGDLNILEYMGVSESNYSRWVLQRITSRELWESRLKGDKLR